MTGWGICFASLFTYPAAPKGAPIADFNGNQLAQLASLNDLIPKNRFAVEAIIFKRIDTSGLLLAQAKDSGPATAAALDNREPLLIAESRTLPSNLFELSPARRIVDPDGPLLPANPDVCFGPDIVEVLEPAESTALPGEVEPAYQEVAPIALPATDLIELESAQTTPFGSEHGMFAAQFWADPAKNTVAAAEPTPTAEARVMALPRNRTEITPNTYLTLIQGMTTFIHEMDDNAFKRRLREDFALHDLARRLRNSGEFEVLEQLAWQQPVPERGAPQPIYVNLNDGELQGHVAVTLGRYLHTQATLWLQPSQTDATSDPEGYALLNQSQRMRSGQLHYFDHPLFGMVVRIDKVSPPADLQAQFATFQSELEMQGTLAN